MTEHTHDHDDDSACAVAHGAVAPPSPATSATGPAATSATGPAATSATGPAATSATGPVATSASRSARAAGERTLVAVFASPVAGYLLRYGADMGFRGLLLEPDEARAAGATALGFPLLAEVVAEVAAGPVAEVAGLGEATAPCATAQAESSSWSCVCSVMTASFSRLGSRRQAGLRTTYVG